MNEDTVMASYQQELLLEYQSGVQSPMSSRERLLIKKCTSLQSQVSELQKALEVVRDTLEHKKNEDRTSWSLWNDANNVLKSIQGGGNK